MACCATVSSNIACLHDTVFVSYQIRLFNRYGKGAIYDIPFSFHIGLVWLFQKVVFGKRENGMKHIVLVRFWVNKTPIRHEVKTDSCKRGLNGFAANCDTGLILPNRDHLNNQYLTRPDIPKFISRLKWPSKNVISRTDHGKIPWCWYRI